MKLDSLPIGDDFQLGDARDLMRGGRNKEALPLLYELAARHPDNQEIRGLIERCLGKQPPVEPTPAPAPAPQIIVVQAPPAPPPIYYQVPVGRQRKTVSYEGQLFILRLAYLVVMGFWVGGLWAFVGMALYLIPATKKFGTKMLNLTLLPLYLKLNREKGLDGAPPTWTLVVGGFTSCIVFLWLIGTLFGTATPTKNRPLPTPTPVSVIMDASYPTVMDTFVSFTQDLKRISTESRDAENSIIAEPNQER